MKRIGAAVAFAALAFAALWWSVPPGAPAAHSASERILRVASALESPHAIAPAHNPAAEAFLPIRASADGATLIPEINLPRADPQSRWRNPAKPVEPVFPKNFADPVRVRCGVADVFAKPVNASGSSVAEITADGLIYRNAFEGCDVEYRCTPYKTEEFLIVRRTDGGRFAETDGGRFAGVGDRGTDEADAVTERRGGTVSSPTPDPRKPTPISFSWDLDLGSGEKALTARLTPAHTIELVDSENVPRLRINAPDGHDAAGKPLRAGEELRYTISGNRVTLAANLEGCEFPVTIDPTWSSTGTMVNIRGEFFTLTKLANGTPIVVGGNSFSFPTTPFTAEQFNLGTSTWASLPNSSFPHQDHAAVLLQNGRLLVMGGYTTESGYTAHAQCEIFNPAGNSWQTVAPMRCRRRRLSALLLTDGRVFVSGGDGHPPGQAPGVGSGPLDRAEIYDPSLDTWTETALAPIPHHQHSLFLLQDGRIALVGGSTGPAAVGSTYLFDPLLNSWAAGGTLNSQHYSHGAVALNPNRILLTGGVGSPFDNVAEVYDASTSNWSLLPNLAVRRTYHTLSILNEGQVIAVGGFNDVAGPLSSTEVFKDGAGFTLSSNLRQTRYKHQALTLNDGRLLVAGGVSGTLGGGSAIATCEILNPTPIALPKAVSVHSGDSIQISLAADSLYPSSFSIIGNPQHGVLNGTSPSFVYRATAPYSGADSFSFKANDGFRESLPVVVTINVTNVAPTATASASPRVLLVGQEASFSGTGADADGDALSYSWNFGDGSTSALQNTSHAYSAAGTYNAVVTAKDIANATGSGTVVVKVFNPIDRPTARFTTSDVVGAVGVPLAFDAAFSSDPENAIVDYTWNFGDGSPLGKGQVISRVFTAVGSYVVSLTVTDADGLTGTTSRRIEVLSEADANTLNSFVDYKAGWNLAKSNTDSLTVTASVNVGDTAVGDGTNVAVEIAGSRFTGTLDSKLRDSSSANQKWTVKANTRSQAAGSVLLRLTVKKATLGAGFSAAGARPDEEDEAALTLPLKIEIGTRTFEIGVPSEFTFDRTGNKGRGGGETD